MADKELVLCNPLCFLVNKFGKQSIKALKSAVTDFYDVDTLVESKVRLLHDVNLMDFTDKLPHIPKRRENANRLTQEADDILILLQFVDERGQLTNLPRYVSNDPDMMPSCRLLDGDMQFLLARFDKLESNLTGFGLSLSAITAELQGVRQALVDGQVLSTHLQATSDSAVGTSLTVNHPATITAGNTITNNNNNNQLIPAKPSWAQLVASTPVTKVNSLRPARNPPYDSQGESTDDQPFEETRSRKKRRRPHSNEAIDDGERIRDQPPSGQQSRQRGKSLIVGKLEPNTNSFTSWKITAAHQRNQFVKKSVFYIGNVNNSVSADMMRDFITTDLEVEVLSLFETKPRQRRRLTSISSCSSDGSHKAFRLCINKDHCDRLLIDSKWPAYVSVSEWFFKTTAVKEVRTINTDDHPSLPIPPVSAATQPDNADEGVYNTSMDACNDDEATVIVSDHSQEPSNYSSIENGDH